MRNNKDNGLFITLVPKFYNSVFLFIGLTTLGTSVTFDWLVCLVECSNVSTLGFLRNEGKEVTVNALLSTDKLKSIG